MSATPLTVLRLDVPCQVPWDEMTPAPGEPNVRHCARCDLNVRDLSALTADEAEAYLNRQRGRTCVSFLHDAAGAVATLDYARTPDGRGWLRRPVLTAVVAMAAIAVGASAVMPTLNRARGETAGRRYGAYSPFTPGANTACATQTRLVPVQLRSDPTLRPLLNALPAGTEVVDLQYNVHPAGLEEDFGQCIALGRRGADGAMTPTLAAVVWLMPTGYATPAELTAADPTHPLKLLKTTPTTDVLIWTDDANLESLLARVNLTGE